MRTSSLEPPGPPIHNSEIAAIFSRVADLLDIEGANPFRVRAYRNAARMLSSTGESLADLIARGEPLDELPGIGKDLAGKITDIVHTGHLELLEELEKKTPPSLLDLMKISSLGPKRIKILNEKLKIRGLKDLAKAARAGKVSELRGFGKKTEAKILSELEKLVSRGPERIRYFDAEKIVSGLVPYLEKGPGVRRVVVAGSFRRAVETVGDLDVLLTGHEPPERASRVMTYFLRYPDIAEVIERGPTRASVRLRSGLQVDVRYVSEESYGAALYYFTGSKNHTIVVRTEAMKKGLKINEYGVFRGKKRVAGKTEEEIFKLVGLDYIPSELRENRGEIESARKGTLPKLLEVKDLRGDLHAHTTESDGMNTLDEMAEAAKARGYEYLAITDHSRRLTVAHGLDEKRIRRQIEAIEKLNGKLHGIVILKAIEVDILENGELDLPDDVLKELDLRVCSIHSKFDLSAGKQTERILRAMDNRYFNILGHPSGRLIGSRDASAIDMKRVLAAAKERGCFLELNSQPDRLDVTDVVCRQAKEMGVKVAISSDAHNAVSLGFVRLGVNQARRGWLERADVINTRPLASLMKLLNR
jgi:DNA polymerase (family 10)